MLSKTLSKYFFSKNKFFLLKFDLKENINDYDNLKTNLENKILEGEEKENIIIAGDFPDNFSKFILFESKNEVIPKDFIDSLEFKKKNYISNEIIEEIDFVKQKESKELVKIFSYLV